MTAWGSQNLIADVITGKIWVDRLAADEDEDDRRDRRFRASSA